MADTQLVVPNERTVVYSTKTEIRQLYNLIDDSNPFDFISDDVCLDPHDEDNNIEYINFRSKNGTRLDRSIATNDFILVGFDKCGISAVLDIPVQPGASLSVKMSTWCNPCHGSYGVEKGTDFGVGMVPYGEGKVQEWLRSGMKTCIENGIQFSSELAIEKMMFSGGGGLAALLAGGNIAGIGGAAGGGGLSSMIEYSYEVMQKGYRHRHFTNKVIQLDVIDVKISYNNNENVFEFSFVQAGDIFKIKCPAKKDNPSMQLYFSCLGGPDNYTYIQIHEVIYQPPITPGTLVSTIDSQNSSAVKREAGNEEDFFPDYNKMFKVDPKLRAKVDAMIIAHTKQNEED